MNSIGQPLTFLPTALFWFYPCLITSCCLPSCALQSPGMVRDREKLLNCWSAGCLESSLLPSGTGPLCSPVASGLVPNTWEVAEVSWE